MAKFEKHVKGNFYDILNKLEKAVMQGSISATYEDGSEYHHDGIDFAIRVYERYSYFGKNRVSLAITIVGSDGNYFVSAITSGGSQAIFFKINRWGENAFLETVRNVIDKL
ncbi:MAG: DUF6054 family protein [Bacilli bacterium]|nr:DUF6054 family protein [Bacilli bacterium]MDD4388344.1 DUF6054 family protein [Bacilli bacterium]